MLARQEYDESIIQNALEYANLAVKEEMTGDLKAAITGYQDCISKFQDQISKAPEDKKQVF